MTAWAGAVVRIGGVEVPCEEISLAVKEHEAVTPAPGWGVRPVEMTWSSTCDVRPMVRFLRRLERAGREMRRRCQGKRRAARRRQRGRERAWAQRFIRHHDKTNRDRGPTRTPWTAALVAQSIRAMRAEAHRGASCAG